MNNEKQMQKQKENQTENKKAVKPFLIVLVISAVIGGIVGFSFLEIGDFFKNNNLTMETISICSIRIFATAAPYAMWILGMAALIYTMLALKKSRKEFVEYGTENESVMEKIEKRLNVGLLLTNSLLLVNYFLFAAHMLAVVRDIYWNSFMFLFSILGLIMSMAVCIIQQQKIVDFVKEMNPEKKGSVYDMKFKKRWMDTCDEAEQMMIQRAAYKAYEKVNSLCLVLFVLFFFSSLIFETGLLPIAIVIGILLYSQLVYCTEAAKEEWSRK